jgi:DNA-binding MarR family transcriptional regulator
MPNALQALELEKFLPYRLSVLAQLVSESLHDLYTQPFGLSVTQWRVMAAVSRAVAGLLKRGLIERATDRSDRRRVPLRLSAHGHAMHARIVPLALAYQERLYEVLSPVERLSFDALSDRLFARAQTLRRAA